jgi:beta-glucanase (GH16 family)
VLRHRVASTGRYHVRVVVTTRSRNHRGSPGTVIHLRIAGVSRRLRTGERGRARLRASMRVKKGTLTIRAIAKRGKPTITITMSRIRRHRAPSTRAATGSSGATGSTGSTATAAVPASPPPLTAKFAPNGAPILALPAGFAPIVNYTSLAKDDEFSGSSLPADWTASANSAHGMNTMYQPSQVTMTGSSVALTAVNTPSGGYPTTSGWISTEGKYSLTHGLIDFSAKMPAGQGLWSGLWLDQPDNSNPWGEIDVQEMLLGNTQTVYGSLHSWAPSYWSELQSTVMANDASAGFHDYQLAWQPGMMTWAIDGIAFAQYTQAQAQAAGYPWVFDNGSGFFLIANLAVGTSSSWGGAPNASTVFPASVLLKSVKIWQ